MIIINHTKVVTYRICKRILINMFYNKHLDFSLNFVISYFFFGGGVSSPDPKAKMRFTFVLHQSLSQSDYIHDTFWISYAIHIYNV